MDRDNIRHQKRMCGILRAVDGYNPIPRASFERVRFRAIGALIPEPVHRVVYHAVVEGASTTRAMNTGTVLTGLLPAGNSLLRPVRRMHSKTLRAALERKVF